MLSAVSLLMVCCATAESPIEICTLQNPTVVEVVAQLPEGIASQLKAGAVPQSVGEKHLKLAIFDKDTSSDQPSAAMLGRYTYDRGILRFRPMYPLLRGCGYRATLQLPKQQPISVDYSVPANVNPASTVVESVFPTASELPANLLKFYIHFSHPMQEGKQVFDQIHLFGEHGQEVHAPWRRMELWSDDAKRLTLWIHPGRVKQGVNLREEFGPVLAPGRKYRLVIDTKLLNADGKPLAKSYSKHFKTTPELKTRPLPQVWQIQPPTLGTHEPLIINLQRPLDHYLAKKYIGVLHKDMAVVGDITLKQHDQLWLFRPAQPWKKADYRIVVQPELEDLAGNTPTRLFDRDLTKPTGPSPQLQIRFQPRTLHVLPKSD